MGWSEFIFSTNSTLLILPETLLTLLVHLTQSVRRRRRLTLNNNCKHRRVSMCLCTGIRACDSNEKCAVPPACKCTSIPYPPMFQQCIPTATAILYNFAVHVLCCTLHISTRRVLVGLDGDTQGRHGSRAGHRYTSKRAHFIRRCFDHIGKTERLTNGCRPLGWRTSDSANCREGTPR